MKVVLNAVYRVAFRVRINGKVPKDGAYVLCCNNINYLDAAAIVLFNKRKVNFVAKEDLFTHGILMWLGHLFDAIPIKRNMQDIDAVSYTHLVWQGENCGASQQVVNWREV